MNRFIIAMAGMIAGTTATAEPPKYNAEAVKAACSRYWGTEYEMVVYCIEERQKGFNYFAKLKAATDESLAPTIEACQRRWGHEWDMTFSCAVDQLDALDNLENTVVGLPKEIGQEILERCTKEWPLEWDMVASCSEDRANGWRALNN